MDSSSSEDDVRLNNQIANRYSTSKFDVFERKYLPAGSIDKLVTVESIVKELDDKDVLGPGDLDLETDTNKRRLVDFILAEAKVVFATTVVSMPNGSNLKVVMQTFMDRGRVDDELPFTREDLRPILKSKAFINDFFEKQWGFLAPVFSPPRFEFNLATNVILPFVIKDRRTVRKGSFGEVFEVKVHKAHCKHASKNVRTLFIDSQMRIDPGDV